MDWKHLRINEDRFKRDFDELAEIGSTGDGGVNRPAFGAAHLAARQWFREKIEEAGLTFRVDGAGNHSGVLFSKEDSAQTLLIGSHLDSVVNGGRFDGALGVLSAFEVLQTIKEAGIALPVHLEVIDFSDEEGTLCGLLGSRALVGELTEEEFQSPRGGRQNMLDGISRAGLAESGFFKATRPADSLAGYLELHIEQGNRLVKSGDDVGVVTAIVGICSYQLTFTGQANHAGTTSMEDRKDAGLGASEFVLAARQLVVERYPGCVVNVGNMEFVPGAYNIIPAEVRLALEFRSADPDQYSKLENELLRIANECAKKYGLGLKLDFQGKHPPALMSARTQAALQAGCETLGLSHVRMPSGAGHDAQSLAEVCPAGMIFIPSVGGISHSPKEYSEWQDCLNGANVLLQAVLKFALS